MGEISTGNVIMLSLAHYKYKAWAKRIHDPTFRHSGPVCSSEVV